MVKQLDVQADFRPHYIEREVVIPVFQYNKPLKQELEEGNVTPELCIDLLECMLLIRNLEEMIVELKENKGRYGQLVSLFMWEHLMYLLVRRRSQQEA